MRKFFVVDNHSYHSSSLESLLRCRQLDCELHDGAAGLGFVHDAVRISRPDIIISELSLPDGQSLELLHALQADAETNHIPLIIYTHGSNRHLMEDCFSRGADHFFIKEEFPPAILIDRVIKIYSRNAIHTPSLS